MSGNNSHTPQRIFYNQRRSCRTLLGHRAVKRIAGRRIVPAQDSAAAVAAPLNEIELQRQAELERELQLARDIQQGLLLAAVPHLPGWELSAVSLPARDLGGDLYDFLPLQGGWQGIMIGDVAGKGLPAALQMAVTRTVFRHEARSGASSAQTLAAVNRGVLSEIPQGMVTMLYALLEPTQGILRLSNAGHTFPLLANGMVQELEAPGLPLGIDLDIEYDEITTTIGPGDTVVFYTDGVTEAFNDDFEMFGLERLQALIESNERLKPRALMTRLLQELRAWGMGSAQSDDVTIVVLRRRLEHLSEELHSIVDDVLGLERATVFWEEVVVQLCEPSLANARVEDWNRILPEVARIAREQFGRGLARELNQQMRLAIEEYR